MTSVRAECRLERQNRLRSKFGFTRTAVNELILYRGVVVLLVYKLSQRYKFRLLSPVVIYKS